MKVSSGLIFAAILLLVVLVGILLISGHQGFAVKLINIIFWALFLGTVFYIWETKNER